MANDAIMKWGSATTVISLTAALTDGNVAGGTTELDNSSTLYPYALAVLDVADTFAAAPTDLSKVRLYAVLNDIDGTDDETSAPATTDVEAAHYKGAFVIHDVDEIQRIAIVISLHGIQKANFYIYNDTGQSLSYTSNPITVKITPFTYTPSV
jgi:hypothetical protein